MHKNSVLFTALVIFVVVAFLSGCASMSKPDEGDFKNTLIVLDHVEISYYTGFYYFSKEVRPTKGRADNYGAPLMIAFIYEIKNPNAYPIMLDGFTFAVLFENFEVNTVGSQEIMWIPAGKTNQLRVPAMFDTRQTFLNLQLPGALKLKEKKTTAWDVLQKWWTGAPDFSFQISASEGSAVFRADGFTRVVPFSATYP